MEQLTETAVMPDEPKRKFSRFRLTPGRLLIVLLAMEATLLLSKPWFSKGWAVLIAVAAVGLFLVLMFLWFLLALLFHWKFQFSIRSLLVLAVAVAIPFSWLAVEMKWAREQKKVVESMLKLGGGIEYDYEYDLPSGAKPPGPEWLRNVVGDDLFRNVAMLGLPLSKVNDTDLEPLTVLNQLNNLHLEETQVTDVGLKYLKGLNQLHALRLDGTNITDAGMEILKGLNQLQSLNLAKTQISFCCGKQFC